MGPNQTRNLLHRKRNLSKGKDNPKMGENICKLCDQQGINLQNLQTGHTAQYHNSSNPKWAEDALKQTYL